MSKLISILYSQTVSFHNHQNLIQLFVDIEEMNVQKSMSKLIKSLYSRAILFHNDKHLMKSLINMEEKNGPNVN